MSLPAETASGTTGDKNTVFARGPIRSPKMWFDWNIAPRCGANGYQKTVWNWPMPSKRVDAFVYLLEWYFRKEASEKIFDMAFSVYRSDKWKREHSWESNKWKREHGWG